jgi:uncharacterized membrane protein
MWDVDYYRWLFSWIKTSQCYLELKQDTLSSLGSFLFVKNNVSLIIVNITFWFLIVNYGFHLMDKWLNFQISICFRLCFVTSYITCQRWYNIKKQCRIFVQKHSSSSQNYVSCSQIQQIFMNFSLTFRARLPIFFGYSEKLGPYWYEGNWFIGCSAENPLWIFSTKAVKIYGVTTIWKKEV